MLQQGDTFFHRNGNKRHLHVVLSDPQKNPNAVYVVTLTTHAANKDQSCVLDRGDHPFIRHKTTVSYNRTELQTAALWEDRFNKGQIVPRQHMKPEVLDRILEGAAISDKVPKKCRKLLKEQGLISDD